ncbi:hypothetical protein N7462_002797 [Penicillium macrosclerotiorum]|uniref:uncharacterized protein n=1 Tax=Penicillium macrosclerotiorum TaxID=303699 RepID=UPI00254937D4|nr:uncharacterized protein N7462_002797 [Penicillium macrosclerotiorum]KAJ5693374.1 hypothetical protein N7462_002797 [Penicillium macrosclerotiorum]
MMKWNQPLMVEVTVIFAPYEIIPREKQKEFNGTYDNFPKQKLKSDLQLYHSEIDNTAIGVDRENTIKLNRANKLLVALSILHTRGITIASHKSNTDIIGDQASFSTLSVLHTRGITIAADNGNTDIISDQAGLVALSVQQTRGIAIAAHKSNTDIIGITIAADNGNTEIISDQAGLVALGILHANGIAIAGNDSNTNITDGTVL